MCAHSHGSLCLLSGKDLTLVIRLPKFQGTFLKVSKDLFIAYSHGSLVVSNHVGCYNKIQQQTGWLINNTCFFPHSSWKERNPRSECWQIRYLVRTHFLVPTQLSSCCVSRGRRDKGASGVTLTRALLTFMRVPLL